MTPVWIPLVASAIGVLGTLAGGLLAYLPARARFIFERQERLRDLQREAIADLIAKGSVYSAAMNDVFIVANRVWSQYQGSDEERIVALKAVGDVADVSMHNIPYALSLQRALMVVQDEGLLDAIDSYGKALREMFKVVDHCLNVSAHQGVYENELAVTARDKFIAESAEFADTARQCLLPKPLTRQPWRMKSVSS
jgi:hypothetical protein